GRAGKLCHGRAVRDSIELADESAIAPGHEPSGGAAPPDAHQIDAVDPFLGERVPRGGGDVCERNRLAGARRQLFEPRPRADFVEVRMRSHVFLIRGASPLGLPYTLSRAATSPARHFGAFAGLPMPSVFARRVERALDRTSVARA